MVAASPAISSHSAFMVRRISFSSTNSQSSMLPAAFTVRRSTMRSSAEPSREMSSRMSDLSLRSCSTHDTESNTFS